MKNRLIIPCIFVLTVLLFSTCDYVKYQPAPRIPFTFKPGVVYRKVLVEDYTGHKCGNCPRAAETLARMEANSFDGFQIVPIAVHAGSYANVNPPTFPTNFQSTAGTAWDNTFGISMAGNPNGLINRKDFGQGDFIKGYTAWGSASAAMDTMIAGFQLGIVNLFDTSTKKLTITVSAKAMKALSGTYNITVVLTEDSIIAEQEDYSYPVGQQVLHNYVFNHVLRGAINSTWGDQVFTGTISNGQTVSKTYFNFQFASNYKAKNCHVIAFIYDAGSTSPTHYEIMQVETQPVQ
ncbi:MAG TPA: Omp28-related outer membrane protein [Bacteroidia bacterium]|jgi:hypothetical protein|nr:Omp28-related outer membrane protein [Bacteroidia bacterium]